MAPETGANDHLQLNKWPVMQKLSGLNRAIHGVSTRRGIIFNLQVWYRARSLKPLPERTGDRKRCPIQKERRFYRVLARRLPDGSLNCHSRQRDIVVTDTSHEIIDVYDSGGLTASPMI